MIEKVEARKFICDNPICGKQFVVMDSSPEPGIRGVAKDRTTTKWISWYAHTYNCIGPAVRAAFKKAAP